MRILHTSDWHIGRFLNNYSLLQDQKYFLDWLLVVLKEQKVNLLVVAGDIYNTASPSSLAVSLLDEFFSRVVLDLKINILIIAGNHDSPEKLGFSSKILQRSGFYIATDLKNIKTISFEEKDFSVGVTLFPYITPAMVKEEFKEEKISNLEETINFVNEKYIKKNIKYDFNILCAHGLFLPSFGEDLKFCDSEVEVGGIEAFNLNLFSEFSYIALGHLHRAQKVGKNARYSGSPIKYSVSEANDKKGVFLVDISKGKEISIEKVHFKPLRDLRVIAGNFKDILKEKSGDYVSIKLTDENFIIDPYNRLKENYPNLLEIEFLNLKLNFKQNFKGLKEIEPNKLFEEFYSYVVERKMKEEEKRFLDDIIKKIEIKV